MVRTNQVLAVVDGADGTPVVWWVDLGPRDAGVSRLCGARVLDGADQDRPRAAYEVRAAAAKKGQEPTPPRWPDRPGPLGPETASAPAGDPRASRALGIARWSTALCRTWDAVEEERLARPHLRKVGGESARPLPVVLARPR